MSRIVAIKGGTSPGTALGSLLSATGLSCCGLSQPVELSETLRTLVPDWLHFFDECGLSHDPVVRLREALALMTADAGEAEAVVGAYHRLFTNPDPPVPVWESLWRSREKILFTECTREVRALYHSCGFTMTPPGEAEDFLGYELVFAGTLFDAACAGSDKSVLAEVFHSFLDAHLLPWAPECLCSLERATDNPFWRALFASCRTVLDSLVVSLDTVQGETTYKTGAV